VNIVYGEPMILKPKGAKITREDINDATETIMRRVAAMLPPQYRGVYADVEQAADQTQA
jgi:1-acyl-sn-glycerol-3-phosphate acyltransferase